MTATEQAPAVVPSRRERRERRRQSGGARALGAVAGVLLIAAAVWVQSHHMTDNEFSDALVYTGDKGEAVDARRFSLRLESLTTAKAIQSSTTTVETDELFLILTVKAKSAVKPYHLGQPVLETADGKKFDATDRVPSTVTLQQKWVQPDIWTSGRYFFEVPASALPGASVTFGLPATFIVESYQPSVEIDLGLDEEAAKKLAAAPQNVYSTDKK
ncbi:unnamed protein product [[Actinomadura] parvosata subsp. kistnae]|uniref:DUF4352 domain-containing protein n=1 Tax=[Actinomadura] parvosata subsp. kistnae TaxID=1909395 RepID=A0A1V0AA24_9ACTN|nr:hypothetical protein [Nonomuraea sp. ATCC 55076]AQZ67057.1 hypothetical protein BKM31_41425 [Nonomuraea sp. ATCC 55076]SPL94755.1 unnamed protein product [Actinomadura parvosata subsp. kistnae]